MGRGTDELARVANGVLLAGFEGPTVPDWVRRRLDEGLGGITLFARNVHSPEQVRRLVADIHARNPAAIVCVDEEGGDVTRLEWATGSSVPGGLALGVVDDRDLTRRVAAHVGAVLAQARIDLDLAPCADVNSNPDNPVIGVRSFGTDAETVSRHTAAWVDGLQGAGVAACVKHFPGHGDTSRDSHAELPVVAAPLDEVGAVHLPPFRAGIAAGARAVMTAHIVLRAYDDQPATLSHRLLTGLLRDELGFGGLIVTDSLEMKAISSGVGLAPGGVRAVAAGADALCLGGGEEDEANATAVRDALVAAVRTGSLPAERLDEATARSRDLASWAARARAGATAAAMCTESGAPPDDLDASVGMEAVGREAARRAVRAHGDVRLTSDSVLLTLDGADNPAVGGYVPWGPAQALRRAFPAIRIRRIAGPANGTDPSPQIRAALDEAAGKPLVLVVRDAARIPWQAAAIAEILRSRPDAIVVEMGVPPPEPWAPRQVTTFGAARVLGEAAADLLARR